MRWDRIKNYSIDLSADSTLKVFKVVMVTMITTVFVLLAASNFNRINSIERNILGEENAVKLLQSRYETEDISFFYQDTWQVSESGRDITLYSQEGEELILITPKKISTENAKFVEAKKLDSDKSTYFVYTSEILNYEVAQEFLQNMGTTASEK